MRRALSGLGVAKLSFLGAAGTVTGSKFLLEHDGVRCLVDCGLFQGLKELRSRNWQPPPFDPASVSAVALTHAHLDHSGWLPVLIRRGFDGPVLSTFATRDLCGIVLPDSGHLQEEDARYANKKGFSKHRPALPLYTFEEARASVDRFRPVRFHEWVALDGRVELRWLEAGHISGAAMIEVRLKGRGGKGAGKTVVFSGDLGRPSQPIVPDPEPLPPCDHLILESTYGNRDHPAEDPKDRLERIVRETVERGGTLLIPSFAVGRTQHLLYLFRELQQEGRLAEDIPIFINSPMAAEATRIVLGHPEAMDPPTRREQASGRDPLGLRGVRIVSDVEESKALNSLSYPAIILAGSGMAEGGRILHHLAWKLPDHRTTVLFVGYQAAGTRGRALEEGAKEVRIHGREIPVRARIEILDSLSAHADRGEIVGWLSRSSRPRFVHLVHGEPEAAEALAEKLRGELGISVHVPHDRETVDI
jgi:metallo-beta-lactamase family protein